MTIGFEEASLLIIRGHFLLYNEGIKTMSRKFHLRLYELIEYFYALLGHQNK